MNLRPETERRAVIAGVDGCSTGWVVVTQSGNRSHIDWQVVNSIKSFLMAQPIPAVMAIDVPIGLPPSGSRDCDTAARARLGPRRSSVFPAPVRPVLPAGSQQEASEIGRLTDGRGVSCQCWNIVPKIREVDALLRERPALQVHVREVHPELSFCLLNGRPLAHPKRKTAGKEERLTLLDSVFDPIEIRSAISGCRKLGAKSDDVLDALIALWSAARIARGDATTFPPDMLRDECGLLMQILA